jgi:hypothetical protein
MTEMRHINSAWDLYNYVQSLNDTEVTQHLLSFHAVLCCQTKSKSNICHSWFEIKYTIVNTDPGCKMLGSSTFSLADLVKVRCQTPD